MREDERMAGDGPTVGGVANDLARAMVTMEPVTPLTWATAKSDKGRPLYLVAVVMGEANCREVEAKLIEALKQMRVVDIFSDEATGD